MVRELHEGLMQAEAAERTRVADEKLCVVCLDGPKTHIFVKCSHMCVCATCADEIRQSGEMLCPLCRTPSKRISQVFG